MTMTPMALQHLDLSRGQDGRISDVQPILTTFWWRDLPLGMLPGSVDEVPYGLAGLKSLTARFAAEQRMSRDPHLGAPLLAGFEGRCRPMLTLDRAVSAEATLDWLDEISAPATGSAEVCQSSSAREIVAPSYSSASPAFVASAVLQGS